ncbi:MAG: hypothetical protein DRO67_08145 [Candidatus Asgardarchaeum californiense]|nr:MAG: hypothetical protein DRO67_08145 [Candidatus Asgardarchaeum californiense]
MGKETESSSNELHEIVFKKKEAYPCSDKYVWLSILNLAETVLFEDDRWHFFYEDSYYIIRCPFELVEDTAHYLFKKNFEVELKGFWTDSSDIVEEYKELFTQLFHINTMFAIQELDVDQIYNIHDRISHCFFNNQYFNVKDLRKEVGNDNWEAVMLLDYAYGRLKYNAKYSQSKNKKESEE